MKIPFIADGDSKLGAEGASEKEKGVTLKTVEYNLGLPQDISEVLTASKFGKRIILENFHYLPEHVQKQMAFDFRVFEDFNILFIVLGIWREKNRLAQFNGDLQDRLLEIPVEPWLTTDFKRVATKGSELLKVSFGGVLDVMIQNSFDSIGVFQELCKESCLAAGVQETQASSLEISSLNLQKAIAKKLSDYSGRHIRSIETFVDQKARNSEEVPLYMGYYFIKYLFNKNFEEIIAGMKRQEIQEGIKAIHHRPDDVRSSDMSYFLHNITATQIRKNILPPLFDYDLSTRTLKIIDSTLYFFLRNANRDEIIGELEAPTEL